MKMKFWTWLIGLVAIVMAFGLLCFFLLAQQSRGAQTAGSILLLVGNLTFNAWVVFGLFRWRHIGWVSKLGRLIVFWLVCSFAYSLFLSLGLETAAMIVLGTLGMATAFFLGLELLRLALAPGIGVLGVARTLLDEAIRMKLGLVFVVMLVVLVPALPFTMNNESRLEYRIGVFLTYGMMVVSVLLSLMTILLAVRSVSSELSERQIFLTLTKPVGRVQYLAGKWLGIMALNLLLLVVSAVGIYSFVKILERQPAMDALDRAAIHEQIITARASAKPGPIGTAGFTQAYAERVQMLRRREPATYGQPGDPISQIPKELEVAIREMVYRNWLTIGYGDTTIYRFDGLADAKKKAPTVQLRIKPEAAGSTADRRLQLSLRVNDDAQPPQPRIREDTFYTIYIDSQLITDEGILDVALTNGGGQSLNAADSGPQPTINFNPADGMEVFYRVGSFEGNLSQALFIVWVRLGFLAMVGLAAATFLGFPVACLLAILIYLMAAASGYLSESLSNYAYVPPSEVSWWGRISYVPSRFMELVGEGDVWKAFKLLIRLVGEAATTLIPSFGDYNPTPLVADGRSVGWKMLGNAVLRVGFLWTGLLAIAAALIFRKREIAKVTV